MIGSDYTTAIPQWSLSFEKFSNRGRIRATSPSPSYRKYFTITRRDFMGCDFGSPVRS